MKTIKLTLIGLVLFFAGILQAQVDVTINIGSPPLWGPVGYGEVRYYYLPDVESYYDVHSTMFIYYDGGVWIHRAKLPKRYRHYDLYRGYKVVMTDYWGNDPYIHFKEHKTKYAKGYRGHEQKTIGEKPGKGNSKAKKPSKGHSTKKDQPNHEKDSKNNNNSGGENGKKK